jgi:hypothetical protein
MRLLFPTVALAITGLHPVHGWKAIPNGDRRLNDDGYTFLVSSIREDEDWCITATEGVGEFKKLGFRLCDFDGAPSKQLWKRDDDKIRSKINPDRCMIVGYGKKIFNGVRIRVADCDIDSDLNSFLFESDGTTRILVNEDEEFCITNQGNNPDPNDTIVAKKCGNTDDFDWTFIPEEEPSGYFGLVNDDAYPESGCLVVKNENPRNDQPLILGNCDFNHNWRYDSDGLFHTELDDDKCMQAGRGGTPRRGTKMRLFDCDKNDELQQFDYNQIDIKLRSNDDLCVGFRGDTSNVDDDPLLLKPCDKNGNNWSED